MQADQPAVTPIQQALDGISHMPRLWNALRWLAEAGYYRQHAIIADELQPFTGDRRFLDFGCGTGEFAADFPADRYVGMDITRPYVEFAQAQRSGSFSVMDGTALALDDATFDAALINGVFHHLPDGMVRDSIGELHRVLRPQAIVLVLEDIPPPTIWNLPGHLMHLLDRGGFIRSDDQYRALFAPHFTIRRSYQMRSGICDYGVYVLERQHLAS